MASTSSYSEDYLESIEQELRSFIQACPLPLSTSLNRDLLNIFQYHLGWTDAHGDAVAAGSGKRLRPLICLLSCEATAGDLAKHVGRSWRHALPAAAAIELVHNFSLIHDDIEDKSAARRGREAVWKLWGMAQGINAGDAMFVLARLALDRLHNQVPPSTYADVHRIFDDATLALTQGQFLDLCFESNDSVTVDDYLMMVKGKTAALFAAAAQIGARIATYNMGMVDAFARYGANLGIAYQIADDILGIWGDPAVTGKSAGDDILARKKSLPLLAAQESGAGGEITVFFSKHKVTRRDVDRIHDVLERVNARGQAEALGEEYVARALGALAETGLSNAALEHLLGMARAAVQREK
jgi:geranylgeranyl diphosphate synthase type I